MNARKSSMIIDQIELMHLPYYRAGKRKKKLDVDGKLRIEIIEQLKLGIAPDGNFK